MANVSYEWRKYKAWIEYRLGSYGFGHEWTLFVQNRKTGKVRSWWLGQDSKFLSRVLGCPGRALRIEARKNWPRLPLWQAIGREVVVLLGGVRAIMGAESWELAGH